jgi:hypothetical protein
MLAILVALVKLVIFLILALTDEGPLEDPA